MAYRDELRSYDGRVGRWMTIDPMEEFWSPYLAFGNTPHQTRDPTGGQTETDYRDIQGNLLLRTNDGSNDVVVISKGMEDQFSVFAQGLSDSGWDLNDVGTNSVLRSFYGPAYDVTSFGAFFDANENDFETLRSDGIPTHIDANGNPVRVANEHATFLYKNSNGVITIGPENIQGSSSSHIPLGKLVPSRLGIVGTLHTHSAQGRNLSYTFDGINYAPNRREGIPSSFDVQHHAPKNGGFSIFTTKTEHVFFNNKGNFFNIPRH